MFCQHCGGKVDKANAKFCRNCGNSVDEEIPKAAKIPKNSPAKSSSDLQEHAKGFVSIWKRIGAFVVAFFVFGIIAQVGTFLEKWIESSSTDPSSGLRDLVAVVQIGSLIGGLLIAQRIYRSMVPASGKHKSFRLTSWI